MTFKLAAIAIAAMTVAYAPAAAASKHHGKRHVTQVRCADQPSQFSWSFLWAEGNVPRWNGCAPPVYESGRFIGQDPDPNVRLQLRRDPAEGNLNFFR